MTSTELHKMADAMATAEAAQETAKTAIVVTWPTGIRLTFKMAGGGHNTRVEIRDLQSATTGCGTLIEAIHWAVQQSGGL